jgi:hypothetical protein
MTDSPGRCHAVRDTLVTEVAACTTSRNAAAVTVQWHFTITDACTKLTRRYPALELWPCTRE